jgi:hypothetical protein
MTLSAKPQLAKLETQDAPKTETAEAARAREVERSDRRVHVALPLRITYWDKDKKPGLEMACTYDISSHGARITSLRCIKETGEIIAIERGRNKTFCRVVWVGEPNSELRGQIGLQVVEAEREIFETERRDLDDVFDPVMRDTTSRPNPNYKGNRRRQDRFALEGVAELLNAGKKGSQKAELRDLSETGCLVTTKQVLLPGTDLKLVLNVANYSLSVKGQVKHSALDLGIGIEFSEIRKGDRQTLQFLLRKLEEKKLEEVFQLEVQP